VDTTSISLLERLKLPIDQKAWSRFVQLYTPLIYSWSRQLGMHDPDAADLVQDVFAQLVRNMPGFVYDSRGSFRSWLKTVTLNKWRDHCRRLAVRPREVLSPAIMQAAEPGGEIAFDEAEYRAYLVARALELIQREFQPTTWRACWEFVVAGRPAAEVADMLGISENAVYLAKGRVLRRLRQELAGLLDA
jgi:RNA polymerase sigma-70 factor (ECF subfamily)